MLFVTYWELNEDVGAAVGLQAANKVMAAGLFPPQNVKIIRWDSTPDNWGILIAEADNAEAIFDMLSVWRASAPGFFKITKTSPALPVQDAIGRGVSVLQKLGA